MPHRAQGQPASGHQRARRRRAAGSTPCRRQTRPPGPAPKAGAAPTVRPVTIFIGGNTQGAALGESCRGRASPRTSAAPRQPARRRPGTQEPGRAGGSRPAPVSAPAPPRGRRAAPPLTPVGPAPAAARPALPRATPARPPAGLHLCGSRRPEGRGHPTASLRGGRGGRRGAAHPAALRRGRRAAPGRRLRAAPPPSSCERRRQEPARTAARHGPPAPPRPGFAQAPRAAVGPVRQRCAAPAAARRPGSGAGGCGGEAGKVFTRPRTAFSPPASDAALRRAFPAASDAPRPVARAGWRGRARAAAGSGCRHRQARLQDQRLKSRALPSRQRHPSHRGLGPELPSSSRCAYPAPPNFHTRFVTAGERSQLQRSRRSLLTQVRRLD